MVLGNFDGVLNFRTCFLLAVNTDDQHAGPSALHLSDIEWLDDDVRILIVTAVFGRNSALGFVNDFSVPVWLGDYLGIDVLPASFVIEDNADISVLIEDFVEEGAHGSFDRAVPPRGISHSLSQSHNVIGILNRVIHLNFLSGLSLSSRNNHLQNHVIGHIFAVLLDHISLDNKPVIDCRGGDFLFADHVLLKALPQIRTT
jgi:hypothetical protein